MNLKNAYQAGRFVMLMRITVAAACLFAFRASVLANDQETYAPAKVAYDLSSPDFKVLGNLLDRASLLQNLYGNDPFEASIVFVVHEGAIPLFANGHRSASPELMRRAGSLTIGEIVEFRLCGASARLQGFDRGDFPEFVKLVPMADAELVRLQGEGYAYLR